MFKRRKSSAQRAGKETASIPLSNPGVVSLESVSLVVPDANEPGASTPILEKVSLDISQKNTAIVGLNGSGKSSVLRLFNGLEAPTTGKIFVHGIDVVHNQSMARKIVGFVFSDPSAQLLMPTPLEDVELSLRHICQDPHKRREHAVGLLKKYELEPYMHQSVYDLSSGQRQLVALVSVLAVEPSLLVLDEPTTLLDLRNRARLIELIKELPQQLVYATHDLGLAALAQHIIVMHHGKVFAQGGPEIIEKYNTWCIEGFDGERDE